MELATIEVYFTHVIWSSVSSVIALNDIFQDTTQNCKLPTDLSRAVAALIFTDKHPDKEW